MALTVKTAGRIDALTRWASARGPASWLVGLRWVACGGMLVTTLAAHRVAPAVRVRPILLVLGGLCLLNIGWTIALRLVPRPEERTLTLQLAIDLLVLGAVLWLSGGLDNPFAAFLVFHVVLAGLMATRRTLLVVTVLALAATAVLWWAPPLRLGDATLGTREVRELGHRLSLAALIVFTAVFVAVFEWRLQVLRRAALRAQRLADLGRALSAMCHELNTPLGTIVIAAKDLVTVGAELGSRDVEELAQTASAEARRASDIITLLRGHVTPETRRETVELNEILPAYVEQELSRLGFAGERVISIERGLKVPVYRAALSQILTNLLRNAVDAMAGREAQRITVSARRTGGRVEIAVVDTGPGVAREVIGRLGEPFATTKRARGGTGLGLYASVMLAERMGGTLEVDSRPGEGTAATLALPSREGWLPPSITNEDDADDAADAVEGVA